MTNERYEQLWNEMNNPDLRIVISETPVTAGVTYIGDSIGKIRNVMAQVVDFGQEVERELGLVKGEIILLQEEQRIRQLHCLETLTEEESHGVPMEVRKAIALRKAEESYVRDNPEMVPMQKRIVELQVWEKKLESLGNVIKAKRETLKGADSAVRLQQKTVEAYVDLFGRPRNSPQNPPTGQTPSSVTSVEVGVSELLSAGDLTAQG